MRALLLVASLLGTAFVGSGARGVAVSLPAVEGPLPGSTTRGTLVWNVESLGYVAEEYFVIGQADVYEPVAMADASNMLSRDNVKDMAKRASYSRQIIKADQPYVTRIIVYRPKDTAKFSGNVVMETAHPLQGGLAIVWSQISGYFISHGDIYVSIPAPVTIDGLKQSNPARYSKLTTADPTQLWGMIAQTAALIKGGGARSPLHEYAVKSLFLTGYSYTGVAATTFADFHHDSAKLADGSHLFDGYIPMANSMYVRPIDVPVIRIMTQSDFNSFGGLNSRRKDSDAQGSRFRLYEVAGASHLNASPVIESGALAWVPSKAVAEPHNLPNLSGAECTKDFPKGWAPNKLPLNYLMVGAFENLYRWVRTGESPPRASWLQTDADGNAKIDDSGNATEGVRLPQISVPAATYGIAKGANPCFLFGYQLPFTAERMKARYASHESYIAAVRAAADAMVARRWLRPQEASAIAAEDQWRPSEILERSN